MDTAVLAPRFTVGRALKDTVAVFGRNIVAFMAVALLVRLIVVFAPNYLFLPTGAVDDLPLYLIRTAMYTLVATLTQAMVIFGAFNSLRGRNASLQDAARGLRFVPLILAGQAILQAPSVASTLLSSQLPVGSMLAAFGAIVIGLASLAIFLMWWLFPVTMMIEGRGLFSAMARSNQLNTAQRWRVFAIFLIFGLAMGVAILAASLLFGVPFATLPLAPILTPAGMAMFVIYAAMTTVFTVLATVTYYRLRIEKEGPFPDDTVRVFD